MDTDKTILVIDDSASLRKIIITTLGIFDFTFLQATGPTEAREILKETQVDLILLDWHMPDMEGYDYFLELQKSEETKSIPVIMLTAENRAESMLKAIRSGIRHYLTKPFTPEDLLARVAQVLKL